MFCNRKMLQKYEEKGEKLQCIFVAWYRKLIQKKHEMSNDTKKCIKNNIKKHKYKNISFIIYYFRIYIFSALIILFLYLFNRQKNSDVHSPEFQSYFLSNKQHCTKCCNKQNWKNVSKQNRKMKDGATY